MNDSSLNSLVDDSLKSLLVDDSKFSSQNVTRDEILQVTEGQCQTLNKDLLAAFEKERFRILPYAKLNFDQKKWLHRYFTNNILPIISPIGIDVTHPFPLIQNERLCFIVSLAGKDAFGRDGGMVVIQKPVSLPDFVQLPGKNIESSDCHYFVSVSSIIREFANDIFRGMKILGVYEFKITRLLYKTNENCAQYDKVKMVNVSPYGQSNGKISRLEIDKNCPHEFVSFLCREMDISTGSVHSVEDPVNLSRYSTLSDIIERMHSQCSIIDENNLINVKEKNTFNTWIHKVKRIVNQLIQHYWKKFYATQ